MSNDETQAASAISDAINCMSHNVGEIGKRLANIHPTLQQSFMGVVMGFLKEIAEKDYVDARNEAAHKLAKRLLDGTVPEDWFLPFI